jgi:uncharacterized membrane protein
MAPLIIVPLLQSLFEAFSPLVRAKVTKALDKQGVDPTASGQVADRLMGIVQNVAAQAVPQPTVTGAPAAAAGGDPVVAVAAVKSDPALLAQAQAQMSDYIDQIAPMLDRIDRLEQAGWNASEESMDRAASRASNTTNDDWMAKSLVVGMLIACGLLVLFLGGVAITQIVILPSHTPTTEVWAAITGAIGTLFGLLAAIVAYRFGTSRTSSAKDFAIAELSTRRKA